MKIENAKFADKEHSTITAEVDGKTTSIPTTRSNRIFREIDERGISVKKYKEPKKTMGEIRQKRDQLLKESDWTQMPDSPLSDEIKQLWKAYRQDLRDLPNQYDDADKVKFPDKPILG